MEESKSSNAKPRAGGIAWHTFGTITRGKLEKGTGADFKPAAAEDRSQSPFPAEYLTIENITGEGGWESSPMAVEPGKTYVLSWSLKCIGAGGFRAPQPLDDAQRKLFEHCDSLLPLNPEGRPFLWHHYADFVGVELVWFGAGGKELSRSSLPMAVEPCEGLVGSPPFFESVARRGDMTADWVPVWLPCEPPAEAQRLAARFAIRSRGEIDAGLAIGDIRLHEPPSGKPPQGMIRLVVRTVDFDSGKLVPSRLSVRDGAGKHHFPPHCFRMRATFGGGLEFFYSLTGEAAIDVPVGRYNIEAVAGLDREVAVAQADYVREGHVEPIELEMVRRLPLAEQGWHCGDHHLHMSGHATRDYPMMDARTGMRMGRADGMDYFPFQAGYLQHDLHGGERLEIEGAVGNYSTEIAGICGGHYCVIHVGKPLSLPLEGLSLYPTMYDIVRAVNRQGGACVAAHPHQMICQPFNTVVQCEDQSRAIAAPGRFNCARELPLMLLLGEPCGYDMLIADGGGVGAMASREYYRLLEFGFRVPCCGATDTGIDSARGCFPSCRTFVRAKSNELADIAEGYRAGRTFATNGPVMLTTADGAGLGDTLTVHEGQEVCVRVEAFSPWGLSHVEVVHNGMPVARRELSGHDRACVEMPIAIRRPGWLAVVVRGPSSRWVNSSMWPEEQRSRIGQIAHSSPIYLRMPDRPLLPAPAIVDYYRRWMDSLLSVTGHYRYLLDTDGPRAGITAAQAWEIITARIAQVRKRIDELGAHGWT